MNTLTHAQAQNIINRYKESQAMIKRLNELRSIETLSKKHRIPRYSVEEIIARCDGENTNISEDVRNYVAAEYNAIKRGEQKLSEETNIATLAKMYGVNINDVKTVLGV